jgi:hypothetical protein
MVELIALFIIATLCIGFLSLLGCPVWLGVVVVLLIG